MLNAQNINLPESLTFNGVTLNFAELTPEERNRTVEYLVSYGLNKTLQDSVAGRKKELKADEADYSEDQITAILREEMQERLDAIVNGTLGQRVGARGPRLETEGRIRRDVINEFFKAFLAKRGQKLPTAGKDATDEERKALAAKVAATKDRYYEANKAKVDDEVSRRLAAQRDDEGEEFELDLDFAD